MDVSQHDGKIEVQCRAAEKGTRTSLKEKLAQMQEKAGTQNRQPDMEKKKEKGKEAVI